MMTRKVAIISTLIAVCIGSNYVLVGVPNVKLMDFVVFIGGYCLGPFTGAVIGALTWVVYGTINPYGFVPQIWLATMLSESIYGAVGGILGRRFGSQRFDGQHFRLSVFFGIMGCFITVAYDSIVNIVYALVFSIPIIAALVLGTPFQILHVVSNTIIFAGGSIPLIRIVDTLLGRSKFGVSPE